LKFTKGLWTHKRFRDVFIEVSRVQYQDHKRSKLKIVWWNKNPCGRPFRIFEDKITVGVEQYDNWERL